MRGQGMVILWSTFEALAIYMKSGRPWLSYVGLTGAQQSWTFHMTMLAPHSSILCMAKSGKHGLIDQVLVQTYI